jgi:Raf kinase inhibitor-like YbhB/YbcL family protein
MSFLSAIGRITNNLRAGEETIILNQAGFAGIPVSLGITSPAFKDGETIPARYTVSGEELSPPLKWSNLPVGTREVVLMMEDYDVPLPKPAVHVIVHGLSGGSKGLVEGALPSPNARGVDPIPRLGKNSLGFQRYDGPAALPGHGVHHYVFELFALGRPLELKEVPGRKEMVAAMEGGVLATGRLTGTFERR